MQAQAIGRQARTPRAQLHPQVGRKRPALRLRYIRRHRGELEAKGFEVDRRKIQLTEPIKSLGDFAVSIKLHREVTAHVKVQVAADAADVAASAETAPVPAVAD